MDTKPNTLTETDTTPFTVIDKATGKRLATFPLTIPIGATVEAFENAGYKVSWTWVRRGA